MSNRQSALLIGYGNTLRGDDAVGVLLAERFGENSSAGVYALAAHQLFPEMVTEIASVSAVFFADAAAGFTKPRWHALSGQQIDRLAWCGSHSQSPDRLLGWMRSLDLPVPLAWWIQLPAVSFEIGAPLSKLAVRGLNEAEAQLRNWAARSLFASPCQSENEGQVIANPEALHSPSS